MAQGKRFCIGVLVIAALSWSGCKKPPEPEKPIIVTLQLARRTWHMGESPWYLLQAKNVGYQRRYLDPFWYTQDKVDGNSDYRTATGSKGHDTYFEIRDPDGKLMVPDCLAAWGYHREFRFWDNANGDPDKWPLRPGQTLTATPTIVAPVRTELRKGFGPADARIPANATAEERKAYGELWKLYKDELAGSGKPNDANLSPKILYPGYRVLECYYFRKPGIYRMKTIVDETRHPAPLSLEEDLRQTEKDSGRPPGKKLEEIIRKEWASITPQQLKEKRERQARLEELSREHLSGHYMDSVVESNTVEIEVVP